MRACLTLIGVAALLVLLQGPTPGFAGEATLSWDQNTEPDLAGYKIYFGTSSGVYGTPIDAGVQTTYTVTGLAISPYYFAVTAYNTAGNESAFSNEVTKTLADTMPPVISAIASGSITSSGATITWTTDEAATSLVEYGTTTAYGTSSALDSTLATIHTRALSGLAPATTYHYRIKSADAAGNLATSGDNTFTTTAAPDTTPPAISGVASSNVTATGATITWTTDEASTSQVQYGTTTAYGSTTTENSALVTGHSQGLTGLLASTAYHFRVLSRDAAGNLATSGDFTLTTSAAPDTTPPVISGITASNVTVNGAVITWTTNEPATSRVEYGISTSYGSSSALNSTPVTSHSRTLTGLAASTTYHYRVTSTDRAGNVATSSNSTFTTSAAPDTTSPVISGVTAGTMTASSAVITWTTNEAGTSLVQYSTDLSFNLSSALNSVPVTSHSRTLTGLSPTTTYNYRVVTTDTAGNAATSATNTLTTSAAPDTTGPVIQNIASGQMTSTSAVISWATDEPATSLVEYGTTSAYGSSSLADSTLVISHSQSLPGLTPGTTYHFRVHSADATGNASRSVDQTLTTPTSTNGTDNTPPEAPRDFSARAGDRQVALTWTNPPDADFVGVRIRFRTDRFPSTPSDGELLGDFTGQPNELMSTLHAGLQNGVTYYYSASSYDSNGNLQSTVHAWAIPSDSTSVQETSPTGGCGMIRPVGGTRSGPGQAADLIVLLAIILVMACHRAIRRPIYTRLDKTSVNCDYYRFVNQIT